MEREEWRRYAAPAGFLLLVTVAVILIHAGLEGGGSSNAQPPVPPPPTTRVETTATTTTKTRKRRPSTNRYWTVRAGDTFSVISRASGVPVATIEQLNPGLSSTSLTIGEKVRIR